MGIMELRMGSCKDCSWWVVALPALLGSNTIFSTHFLFISVLLTFVSAILLTWVLSPGGGAWSHSRSRRGSTPIPGPRGLPLFGSLFTLSRGLPHRSLASLARAHGATQLMAFSIGATPAVVSCDAGVAREVLTHACFADRPLKASARELMFARAIGFAPSGAYWRLLRRIASTHLFAPRLLQAFSPSRQADSQAMLQAIAAEQAEFGAVQLRRHLQHAALNNIMGCVFGKRYDVSRDDADAEQLKSMVREGFELLGAFNWSDHLPWLTALYDPSNLRQRCAKLVPRVRAFIKAIIDKHNKPKTNGGDDSHSADFVDVLLSLEGEEKLADDDMIAVLWEMIFRGTDTVALLTEWAMAELVLNPVVQAKLRAEVDSVGRVPTDSDVAKLPYLNAVIKETLRSHPPGPLLSWARMSMDDVQLRNGMVVPAGTTAMVNMWAITHDPAVWAHPDEFRPERFLDGGEGADVDVRGGDLRLAPFGAGRRVCPGKSLGIVTAALWLARLVYYFEWAPAEASPVLLDELLKLSCEMKSPLVAVAIPRKEDGEH